MSPLLTIRVHVPECSIVHRLNNKEIPFPKASQECKHLSVLSLSLWYQPSDVSWSALLHASSLRFGDVLVVGLVFQLSAEVLDGFVQTFLQRHLSKHKSQSEKSHVTRPHVVEPPSGELTAVHVISLHFPYSLFKKKLSVFHICVLTYTEYYH